MHEGGSQCWPGMKSCRQGASSQEAALIQRIGRAQHCDRPLEQVAARGAQGAACSRDVDRGQHPPMTVAVVGGSAAPRRRGHGSRGSTSRQPGHCRLTCHPPVPQRSPPQGSWSALRQRSASAPWRRPTGGERAGSGQRGGLRARFRQRHCIAAGTCGADPGGRSAAEPPRRLLELPSAAA